MVADATAAALLLEISWSYAGPEKVRRSVEVSVSSTQTVPLGLKAPQLGDVLALHHSALLLHRRSVSVRLLDLHDDPLEDLHGGLQPGGGVFNRLLRRGERRRVETSCTSVLTSFSFAEDSMNAAPQESASFFPSSG